MNDTDVTNAMRSVGMLADVSISVWGGTKSDPDLLEEIKRNHGAVGDVGRVLKNLLAGHDDRRKAATSAHNAIRQYHYETTLAWVSDPHAIRHTGPRLLTYPLLHPYLLKMGELRRAALEAKADFVEHYEDDAAAARANLGSMASRIEYPSKEQVEAAFHLFFEIDPIPDSAQFRGLPKEALADLVAQHDAKREHQIEGAVKAAWAECRARVEYLAGRLTAKNDEGKDATFRDSTVENVKELLTLLPGWNITDNPQVGEIVADIRDMLGGVSANSLRRDEGLRATTVAQAQGVVDKLKGWGL